MISFSGGRTSGYMLWRILQAHGGVLPDDVLVCFDNTGREMPATLDFVRDCQVAWGVEVHWLEYRWEPGHPYAVEVGHNSASRDGEPFEAAIRARNFLPNPVTRFCTAELKIRTTRRFIKARMGWARWLNVVGLRADEQRRVLKLQDPARIKKDGFITVCPLSDAGVDQSEVFRFWQAQPFDLMLAGPWEGNCDGCMLKGRGGISRMLKDHPGRMAWWARMEAEAVQRQGNVSTATFREDREPYAVLAAIVRDQGSLPFDIDEVVIPCDEAGCGV